MITPAVFSELVSDAYQHFYDLAALRTHALTRLLLPEDEQSSKEKAWEMHMLLMKTIEELNPGPQAPVTSAEWRRYRLLQMRYIEGAEPQVVADSLFISRRHFYRELPQALHACAQILWNRFEPLLAWVEPHANNISALDQLRIETAKFQHPRASADVKAILQGVAVLLKDLMEARGIEAEWLIDDCLPPVGIDGNILRQLLLGLMNFLLGEASIMRITIATAHSSAEVVLTMVVHGHELDDRLKKAAQPLALVQDLADLNGVKLSWKAEPVDRMIFLLKLPTVDQRSILVADDNPDIRRLICSMFAGRYRVIEAANGLEVVRLAKEAQPCAILLDLMMPESDGWEALQRLKNGEATSAIPVVIFSVLAMRDLALSLGAAAFLEKPVSETALIEVFDRLVNYR